MRSVEEKGDNLIRLCLVDSVLLNVFEEKSATSLCKKLGNLYQDRSIVIKLFLKKKKFP